MKVLPFHSSSRPRRSITAFLCAGFLILTGSHAWSADPQGLDAEEPFRGLLLKTETLMDLGGVRRFPTEDGGFVIISTAFTSNSHPVHRRTVAKSKALKELVAYIEGIEVDSRTSVRETTVTVDKNGSTEVASETVWEEEILSRVRGLMKGLPTVATWTTETGEFFMAIGGVFDANGNRVENLSD